MKQMYVKFLHEEWPDIALDLCTGAAQNNQVNMQEFLIREKVPLLEVINEETFVEAVSGSNDKHILVTFKCSLEESDGETSTNLFLVMARFVKQRHWMATWSAFLWLLVEWLKKSIGQPDFQNEAGASI